jgi:hypothetical protein
MDPYFTLYTRINSMYQRPKHQTLNNKTLRRALVGKIHTAGFGHDFLDTMPKMQAIKKIRDKLNFIKINNFFHQNTQSGE